MAIDPANKSEVRAEIIRLAGSLLVGPLAHDEVLESAPVDTYLSGILWPRGAAVDAGDDETGLDKAGDDETGAEAGVPGYRAVRPCSIGLTFAVKEGTPLRIDLGTTARYEQDGAGGEKPQAGTPAKGRRWARHALGYSLVLPSGPALDARYNRFNRQDGSEIEDRRVSVHVRRRVSGHLHVYTVTLINEEVDEEGGGHRDSRCLFQCELRIAAELDGKPAIVPRPKPPVDGADDDALVNALLYRDVAEFAVGHGVAAMWDSTSGSVIPHVRTAWIPVASVKGTSTAGHKLLKDFLAKWPDALSAAFLSEAGRRKRTCDALSDFAATYRKWIAEYLDMEEEDFAGDLDRAARRNIARCGAAAGRIEEGIALLRSDDSAWAAFVLANAAMDKQARFPAKGPQAGPLVWRPFQLAFILLVLPGLVDPRREDRGCMDLLWFPTGGGKTEAYLGLTAFQIFHRRLMQRPDAPAESIDVLMRYTLRLLTVQQFQRATALITACDLIRESDARLGTRPISLGLYVGSEATPNSMEDARKALVEEDARLKPKSTPRQLLRCPVCGGDLRASSWRAHATDPAIDVVCDAAGCEIAGRPLPILTVDEAIYIRPPSLLIGTIDKFAQIPRSLPMRRLFGLDSGQAPGLVIQDELHLISGPLGSIAGLYETVIDALCTRNDVRPKVIGSTATIGQAESQVRALFDRRVLQFPPPGFVAADSFFAVRDDTGPDRLYVGVTTAGRSPKFALQALIASLMQACAFMHEKGQASDVAIDPFWTCVAYFNSLRELGGAYVLMQDDVPRQMQFLAGRLGAAVRQLQKLPVELSSRKTSRELPELLQALGADLERFMDDPIENEQPTDSVLASNMISVGVDVPRLGLMVVNGQPKSTAEYIQASSRVGRGIPGLVFTLYNAGRPRDLSHYEHFRSYHAALYRSVEATSVTPWAPRARDKALHAVLASMVRHLVPGLSADDGAAGFDPTVPGVAAILALIRNRVAAAVDACEAAETSEDLAAIVAEWLRFGNEARGSGTGLRYWKKKTRVGPTIPYLMCSAEEAAPGANQAWPTPNTMREVEPSSAFVLKTPGRGGH
jgi:hypothetical protein